MMSIPIIINTQKKNIELYALVCEMEAVKVRIEGMKAENVARSFNRSSCAYNENDFFTAERELIAIAAKMRELI